MQEHRIKQKVIGFFHHVENPVKIIPPWKATNKQRQENSVSNEKGTAEWSAIYIQQDVTGCPELNANIYLQLCTSIKSCGGSPLQGWEGQGDREQTHWAAAEVSDLGSGRADLSDFGLNKTCRGMLVATIEEAPCIIHHAE